MFSWSTQTCTLFVFCTQDYGAPFCKQCVKFLFVYVQYCNQSLSLNQKQSSKVIAWKKNTKHLHFSIPPTDLFSLRKETTVMPRVENLGMKSIQNLQNTWALCRKEGRGSFVTTLWRTEDSGRRPPPPSFGQDLFCLKMGGGAASFVTTLWCSEGSDRTPPPPRL